MIRTTGRSAFISILEDEGVQFLFGNPGTTELPIMDALASHPDIKYVLGLQESVVMGMADGYARASGRLAVANVHVAPGLGNALGGIYNAKFYGSPLLVTAGQHPLGHGLTEPLLYHPLVPMVEPLVKWATEVTRLEDLPRIVRRAVKVALTPPMGPVFLSMPGDILDAEGEVEFGAPTRVDAATRPSQAALEHLADRLLAASAPVILAGQELNTSDALAEAVELAELLGAAVYQQTVTSTTHFPSEHPLFMGAMTRLQHVARETLEHYDLLFALGADVLRMGPHGSVDPLPEGMPLVQVAQRDWELGKNYPTEIALKADVRETLRALLPVVAAKRTQRQAEAAAKRAKALVENNWSARRESLRAKTMELAEVKPIQPDYLMMRIAEELPRDAVIVEEGILSTRNFLAFHALRDAHCFYGLATGGIGFAIAGAIGVQLALPDRPVMCLVGDGSAMYSIQALWTAAHLNLPIKFVITNNRSYRILKERLAAYQGDSFRQENIIGMDLRNPAIDFAALAQSMGVPAHSISDPEAVVPALREALSASGPVLLDVQVFDGYVS